MSTEGRQRRSDLPALLAICAALYCLVVLAAAPSLECRATLGPTRVLVNVRLRDFFDPELLRLVRLGLEGQLYLEIKLVQQRRFWFNQNISTHSAEMVFSYAKEDQSFWLDARTRVEDPLDLELGRFALSLGGGRALEEGAYWIEAKARLQVVTAASLSKVAGWLGPGSSGEERSAAGTLISEGVGNALANELSHSGSGTCPVPATRR